MADKPHAAGIMFEAADGRILFLKRSATCRDHPNTWCFPGGGIDPGEGPKRAARREAQEEIGYTPARLGNPIDHYEGFATYRVKVGGAFSTVLNDEHTEAIWRRPSDAPEPLHPGVGQTLDKMAKRAAPNRYQTSGVRLTAAGRQLRAMDATPKTFTPIHPAAPIRIRYEQRLDAAIDEMARSLKYWTLAAYRSDTPATVQLAQDAAASRVLQAAYDKLAARWLGNFDRLAPKLADWFATASKDRTDSSLKTDLRKAGFTVRFKMTRAMQDAYNAVVDENIALIKSIASQHLTNVKVDLMQSVQNGRDIGYLAKQLEERAGVTKRRAARIARDQNNKATAVMVRTRQLELGVTRAKWLHSAGGKTPRPAHVAFSGQIYDIATGHDFDDGEGPTWPGVPINCRCVAAAVIPGFDD